MIFDHRVTLYCNAPFDKDKWISLPPGFTTQVHKKELTESNGNMSYLPKTSDDSSRNGGKVRQCALITEVLLLKEENDAEKSNITFRLMQSDMYNLFPVIGAVNAERGNKNFGLLSASAENTFGSCAMKISSNRAEPPKYARGTIARAYKYMAYAYPIFKLSKEQERLMDVWDRQYPVEKWECVRTKRIERIQGNENPFR